MWRTATNFRMGADHLNEVTDAGMPHLAGLTQLEQL